MAESEVARLSWEFDLRPEPARTMREEGSNNRKFVLALKVIGLLLCCFSRFFLCRLCVAVTMDSPNPDEALSLIKP